MTSNLVTLRSGETKAPLPITIIDDIVPEKEETFTVTLDRVSGGGVLGTITQTNVVIQASDDLNGAFGMSLFYLFMPTTLEKLKGHIALGSVHASVQSLLSYSFEIPHQKIIDTFFKFLISSLCAVMPFLKGHNEIL